MMVMSVLVVALSPNGFLSNKKMAYVQLLTGQVPLPPGRAARLTPVARERRDEHWKLWKSHFYGFILHFDILKEVFTTLLRRARSPVKSCKAGNSARRNYLTGSERPVVTCLEWHRRSNAEPRRIKGFNAPPLGAGESEQFAGWRRTQNGCPDFSRSG